VRQARATAAASNRRFEEVVAEWVERGSGEQPVESLPDVELLAASDSQLAESLQTELSILLARNRETTLIPADRSRLDELLNLYRRGLIFKARATKEAVSRGLKSRLGDHAA
jgi:hypothetical protein